MKVIKITKISQIYIQIYEGIKIKYCENFSISDEGQILKSSIIYNWCTTEKLKKNIWKWFCIISNYK